MAGLSIILLLLCTVVCISVTKVNMGDVISGLKSDYQDSEPLLPLFHPAQWDSGARLGAQDSGGEPSSSKSKTPALLVSL